MLPNLPAALQDSKPWSFLGDTPGLCKEADLCHSQATVSGLQTALTGLRALWECWVQLYKFREGAQDTQVCFLATDNVLPVKRSKVLIL